MQTVGMGYLRKRIFGFLDIPHRAVDITLDGCRVVSNPRGYPGEQTGFDPGLVISLS